MSDPFDSGGGGGSSSSSTASNDVTVNVTVDNADVAKALTMASEAQATAQTASAVINAEAIKSVAAGIAATAVKSVQAIQENTKATLDAYAAHVDGGSKATVTAALIGAVALFLSKGD
jgi:hypothetical protein